MAYRKRVLVVDDDEMVATVISLMLTELGFECKVSDSPQTAIDSFRSTPLDFDIVITDLTMPDISGLQLAASLKEIRADVPILVMSGYTGAAGEMPDTKLVSAFLSKPLLLNELEEALNSLTS